MCAMPIGDPAARAAAQAELDRARAALQEAECDWALLSSLANVTYVSGYEVPVPIGALAEFAYGSALALIGTGDHASCLVVPDGAVVAARVVAGHFDILPFDTFDTFRLTDSRASYLDAVEQALTQAGLLGVSGRLAVEARAMPHALGRLLAEKFPRLSLIEAAEPLQQARLIKTEREIALLRRAAQVGDVGHNTLAELAHTTGLNEFAMWGNITSRIHEAAGHEIPITGELVTGPRTTTVEYPNGPRARTTEAGDAALMDISGRVDGYWFDCTNTHVVGGAEPSAEQRRFARASQAACEAAIAALRPGQRACDAYAAAEAAFQAYGLPIAHYAGHQIGVTVNELPRLAPYDQTQIEAGMVFSVEPGAYQGPGGTFGARSEKMVLVTVAGPELLSHFVWGI